jgi:hypothetical protein
MRRAVILRGRGRGRRAAFVHPGGAEAGRPSQHASWETAAGTSRLEGLGGGRGWRSGSIGRRRGHLVHRAGKGGDCGREWRGLRACALPDARARGSGERRGHGGRPQ